MKILRVGIIFMFSLFPFLLNAQIPDNQHLIYNNNGSVTFVLNRPDCKQVRVYCDCALRNSRYNIKRESLRFARMKSDGNGVFTFTTSPLAPEVYTYQFKSHGRKFVDPSNADSIRVLDGKRSVFVMPGSPISDLCLTDSLHGRTELFEFEDTVCGKTRRIFLYLPPGYDGDHQTYPVLYLLHGINGNEWAWHDRGRAVQVVDNLIRQGKTKPMIVVMPDANPRNLVGQNETVGMMRNLLHYYTWSHLDFERVFPQMDSLLSIRYRISSDRSMRAVAGLSAGAMQSSILANMYVDDFQYVGMFSPIVHRKQLPNNLNTSYWIGSGQADFFHSQSLRFVKHSRKQQIPCLYFETGGGHTWRNWRLYLSEFLQYVFKNPGE